MGVQKDLLQRANLIILAAALVACSRVGSPSVVPAAPQTVSIDRHSGGPGYKIIFSFDGADGSDPLAAMLNVKGRLYGTTSGGGDWSTRGGTAFVATPDGNEQVLHSFGAGKDGSAPLASLSNLNGTLYGTTPYGGQYGEGTVFSIDSSHREHVLHSFGKGHDGSEPYGGLTALNGNLYGTTVLGGAHKGGTVFVVTTAGEERVLHDFPPNSAEDGANPVGNLTVLHGILYGVTIEGGDCYRKGSVFTISTTGDEKVFYNFGCGTGKNGNGTNPDAGLIAVKNTLYGTTESGGPYPCQGGVVYSVNTHGVEHVLHDFCKAGDGAEPMGALIAAKGALYGTTYQGGANDYGTIFRVTLSGHEQLLHNFSGPPDGQNPSAGLTDVNGTLYGIAWGGAGRYPKGAIFKISP